MKAEMILELDNIHKAFGAVVVSDRLSLGLEDGEALGIIGPNGAGKTSIFNLITGTLKPDAGRVLYDGKDVTRQSTAQRSQIGMARSFQIPQPFAAMTVFENAMVAATQSAGLSAKTAETTCLEVIEQTGLMSKINTLAGTLTLLDRKKLELTRALCAKPKLLMLDEIAGGLTEGECATLVKTIKKIHANGVSIIWIEHVVHALLAVVDRLIVIDFGKKIADGEPHAIMQSPDVQEIYLGIEVDA